MWYHQFLNWLEQHLLTCPSKWFMHMDCPGCGLQTSILALLRGEWYHSFAIYPATVPILLMFIYLALHLRLKFKQGDKLLVYAYFFCAGIIFISYIYKIVNTNLN